MNGDHFFAPLPSELRRRNQLAAEEAVQGVQWRDDCPPEVGRKVAAILRRATNAPWRVYQLADEHYVAGSSSGFASVDSERALGGQGTDLDRLDALAAVIYAFVTLSDSDTESVQEDYNDPGEAPRYETERFISSVNDTLLAARVEWHFDDGSFTQRGNSVLYTDVVKPATILLESSPRFTKASAGFNAAITRLSENKPDVAITDAASAVQEMFRGLGVTGNSITDQLDAAQRKGIITAVDRMLLRPIVNWVNADRSERGNAHHHRAGDVSKADAWLAIHVAGALMVRLSNEEPRDIVAARDRRDQAAKRAAELLALEQAAAKTETDQFDPWAPSEGQANHWRDNEPPF
ncbi:hypothetical protein J2T11_003271 [Paenarthrobacter nicotinovorans]|uniref:hypothetical protein n=1 Tax=Paenarthrobacter nicotinovorans TaxID=29320 RepID=UPI00277E463B|nr:hypothetical protein [Paenarthrobacter nicotinovorans]MDP9936903.1 hypothetical protein [Paenarthrobacter nicotinovorans]